MHESKRDTDGVILYKSMTTFRLLQVVCAMAAIDQKFQLSCMNPNFLSYTQCYECEALNYENLMLQTSVMFSSTTTF